MARRCNLAESTVWTPASATLTSLPRNPLDGCEVDANAIIRETKEAMHANGSCDAQ